MAYRKDYQPQNVDVLRSIPTETKLPIDRPIASYYRQSTEAQVGNISTTIQTVDMPAYLERLGWKSDDILMIDMDQGVSGTTKIDERKGMKMLFGLITEQQIGAVACQDEDRLFRDVTQIQVNIFIEACKSAKVLIITPSMIYDFAHPSYGTHHARQFRFKSEMAAEYIESIVLGRLYTARRNLYLAGRWAGSSMPVGYMADMRKALPGASLPGATLPGGSQQGGSVNEQWRRLAVFEPYAVVIREYYRMFLANSGNLSLTLRQIRQHGPYYPDPSQCPPPEGFKTHYRIARNADGWCPKTVNGLVRIFSNATYLGHAMFKNSIVRWNSHPPIIDEETFFRAFNYISPVGLDGRPNPDYHFSKAQRRPSREEDRPADYPLLSGLVFSEWEGSLKPVGTHWRDGERLYAYGFYSHDGYSVPVWRKSASYLDQLVVALMLEKLKQTFDGDHWQQAVDHLDDGFEQERRLKQAQLRQLQTVMENLIVSLGSLSTPQLIEAVEMKYRHAQAEQERLQADLAQLQARATDRERLKVLQSSFAEVLENWPEMTADEQRQIVHALVERVEAQKTGPDQLYCVIRWKDGSTDEATLGRAAATGTRWLPPEVDQLVALMESDASKLEIASAFPDMKWYQLLYKYRAVTGEKSRYRREKTVRKGESYHDYLARMEANGEPGGELLPCSSVGIPQKGARNSRARVAV